MRCSSKFAHRLRKRRVRLAAQSLRQIQTSIDHVVARSEHQCTYSGYGGDLFGILNALDRLDLRDDADVVVACGDVVVIIGIERGVAVELSVCCAYAWEAKSSRT